MMCGGTGEVKEATDEIQALVDKVRPQFDKKSGGRICSELKAVQYKSQVVAGTNFFIKVSVGGNKYAHLRVFRPLPGADTEEELTAVQLDKTLEDAVEHFQ